MFKVYSLTAFPLLLMPASITLILLAKPPSRGQAEAEQKAQETEAAAILAAAEAEAAAIRMEVSCGGAESVFSSLFATNSG